MADVMADAIRPGNDVNNGFVITGCRNVVRGI